MRLREYKITPIQTKYLTARKQTDRHNMIIITNQRQKQKLKDIENYDDQ